MSGPTRRRLLTGASTGAVLLATGTAMGASNADRDDGSNAARSGESDADRDSGPSDEGASLDVSIVDTNAPVGAGDRLDVVAAVENRGSSDVRAEVDLLVGDDRERVGRVGTTIEAGETTTVTSGFDTYPVPTDSEFPIRVEAGGSADRRTVGVTAASPLDDASPERDVAVQPGTELLFEVGAIDPDESQTTLWWVDGERVGDTRVSPWQATYYAETGAHYWREAFDTTGTHDVAAAVVPREGEETYAAHWEVTVSEEGTAAPSIDGYSPGVGELSYERGETAAFELDLSHPDGELDRVVWWLTQADAILGVTDLAGTSDAAVLSIDADRLCYTCHVVPWVIAADGTIVTPDETWGIGSFTDPGAGTDA